MIVLETSAIIATLQQEPTNPVCRHAIGRAATLNLGDMFAYRLARERDLPLLFRGNDFARTDVRDALEQE